MGRQRAQLLQTTCFHGENSKTIPPSTFLLPFLPWQPTSYHKCRKTLYLKAKNITETTSDVSMTLLSFRSGELCAPAQTLISLHTGLLSCLFHSNKSPQHTHSFVCLAKDCLQDISLGSSDQHTSNISTALIYGWKGCHMTSKQQKYMSVSVFLFILQTFLNDPTPPQLMSISCCSWCLCLIYDKEGEVSCNYNLIRALHIYGDKRLWHHSLRNLAQKCSLLPKDI